MLRNIQLTNFKCFEQLDLDCKPINLLCGLNGMGKSSVIQALLVLRQSFETGELSRGRLVFGGDRIDLGTGFDVLLEDAENEVLRFKMTHDCEENGSWEISLDLNASECVYLHSLNGWEEYPPFGGHLVYVNAERLGPRKMYQLSDVQARRSEFGTSGEYVWNYLNYNQDETLAKGDPRCVEEGRRRLRDMVDMWLQDVCPGVHLQLQAVTDADALIATFNFDRVGDVASKQYRATNVGFGLSYVLPVIIALLSPPGTLCLIENPEAHLHPRGQTKLAELAVRAAKAGVQVFAETHSDHFMDGVRIAVRDGLIAPEDTGFHYFERNGNKAVVTSPQVDSDGRLSRWPDGFFDQHEENLARLISPRP